MIRADFSSPSGLSGARLAQKKIRASPPNAAPDRGVCERPRRGAPRPRGAAALVPLRAQVQRDGLPPRSPPSPGALAGTHRARGPALRAGPRSGSARPAQAPVVAAAGPLCGALWEPRERALGPWRGRCRGLSMVPPARGLERPGRCAGGARGAPGAGRILAPRLAFPRLHGAARSGPTWAPPRGHRRPWRGEGCCCCYCCCFSRSPGCPRAPGILPATCSTAPAWVRPP